MNDASVLVISVVAAVLGVVVLFFVIRFAVQYGTTAALRAHEAWMHDGSRETYLDEHVEDLAERERLREEDQQILGPRFIDAKPSTPKDLPS